MSKLYLPFLLTGVCLSAPYHESTYPLPIPLPAPIKQPSVLCTTQYATVWHTEYKETETQVCTTEYDKHCATEYTALCLDTVRTECQTVYQSKCETVYKTVCQNQLRTEYEPFLESVCTVQYKTDCEYRWEGEGNSKIWATVPGTCKENPYHECKDVPKTKERQVAYPVCREVPQEKCVDVPSQACKDFPEKKCVDQPHETCQDIPRENCHNEHTKIPLRVSRKIPKQVCIHADGYTATQGVHPVQTVHPVHPVHPGYPVHPIYPANAGGAVIPSPIFPTPTPAVAILPNGLVRTPKAVNEGENEEASEKLENENDLASKSDKLVNEAEEKEEKTTENPKSNDAVVFKN